MAQEFTRKEFHALVWSKPMTHLAKEFGLSDVALHKVCRKHGVPTPPAGWWAKKNAGKEVAVTPLPPSPGSGLGRIMIAGGELRDEPPTLAIARENARVLVAAPAIEVIEAPHPTVERTLAKLRKARPSSDNGLASVSGPGRIQVAVAPASIDRVEISLTNIASALRAIGADIAAGEKAAVLRCEGEKIAFTITEGVKREPHVLTAKEEKEQKAWEVWQERRRRSNHWSDYRSPPRFPEWDYHPTGQLAFEMEQHYFRGSTPRRAFRDGKTQKLETLAGDIAVGVAVMAVAIREDRIRRAEEARLREEATQRRLTELRARHIEERRDKALEEILVEVAALERLGHLITALHADHDHPEDRVAQFLEHADRRLAEKTEELTSGGLQRRFEKARLFGDDDDHGFQTSPYR